MELDGTWKDTPQAQHPIVARLSARLAPEVEQTPWKGHTCTTRPAHSATPAAAVGTITASRICTATETAELNDMF